MSLEATNLVEKAALVQENTLAVQQFIMHHLTDRPLASVPFLSWHGLMIVLAAILLIVVFGVIYNRKREVPHGLTNLLEVFVVFVRDEIAVAYLGEHDGKRMTPIFCSFFFFIMTANLIGLVPCFAAATANLSVTAALACISLSFMIFGAMYKNGVVGFFRSFAPHGVPWPVLIILMPIELIGLFIKAFALMIRLFANELAGHMVVFFLLGLIAIFGYAALPSAAMAVFIYIFEVFVAVFQAYIFTLLSAIFIGQTYHPAH